MVVITGEEFLRGVTATVQVPDFPAPGETATLVWNESTQHLELTAVVSPEPEPEQVSIDGWTFVAQAGRTMSPEPVPCSPLGQT